MIYLPDFLSNKSCMFDFCFATTLVAKHIPVCNSTLLECELFNIYIYLYLIHILVFLILSGASEDI